MCLLADVIEVSQLGNSHEGFVPYADRTSLVPEFGVCWSYPRGAHGVSSRISFVEEVRSYIEVSDSTIFNANGGLAILNFGSNKIGYESTLKNPIVVGDSSLEVVDGSSFPLSNFYIYVGKETRKFEIFNVVSRTGNVLTITPTQSTYDHIVGETVRLISDGEEIVTYTSKETGKILFSRGVSLTKAHSISESVANIYGLAIPSRYATDFPFYIPSDWETRLRYILDLARAAGVEVRIILDR